MRNIDWMPFEEARDFVHRLELKSFREWYLYSQGEMLEKGTKPDDIPSAPQKVYKDKWISWRNWLGTEGRPFEKARAFVHKLKLKSNKEWRAYCRGDMPEKGTRPLDIPSTPIATYKDEGWISWPDWLGTQWRPFEEARDFVHTLELKSSMEWYAYCRGDMPEKGTKPLDISSSPWANKGWISWPDWLGTSKASDK